MSNSIFFNQFSNSNLVSAEEESVVSVFENTRRKLHTTRTWDFLGMSEKLQKRNSKAQSNIIVGLLDTGWRMRILVSFHLTIFFLYLYKKYIFYVIILIV